MSYDKDKIKQQLLSNIKADEHISTFEDAAATVDPSRKTLYDWEFHKCDDLKSLIANNGRKVKQNLRKQWASEKASPTLQLALYKLLSNDHELKALSMEYKEHSGKIDFNKIEVEVVHPESKG